MFVIPSNKHDIALRNALDVIKQSSVFPFVDKLYLYGSCAQNKISSTSDVDLFMVINNNTPQTREFRKNLLLLKSDVTSDNINEPEVDLKIVTGNEWENSTMNYYKNVKKDGIILWD